MKSSLAKIVSLSFLFLAASGAWAQGQLSTWLQTSGSSVNLTNIVATNQVLEILSLATDGSSEIDVTAKEQTITFGNGGGTLLPPVPFVIAGPATVVFRRSSAGGLGGFVTYRISSQGGMTPR